MKHVDGWEWDTVFNLWHKRLKQFGASVDPLFRMMYVSDPLNPTGRDPLFTWCATESMRKTQKELQRFLNRLPGRRGLSNTEFREGEITTLEYLWQNRHDRKDAAAILISASLFGRIGGRRNHYPRENWPAYQYPAELSKLAASYLEQRGIDCYWSPTCTQVIPYESDDSAYKIDDIHGLIRYLAEEHAVLLNMLPPVVIEFVPIPPSDIARELAEEDEKARKSTAEWEARQQDEAERLRREREQTRNQHPRYGEWERLGRDELQTLVWSRPSREVANEFGVSDVAVGKRCRSQHIPKPPPGFWAKVAAGVVPHPNGCPPDANGNPPSSLSPKSMLRLVKK